MARIDPRLLKRLRDHLGLSRSGLYRRIDQKNRELLLFNTKQAALALALESGLGVARYATPEDAAVLRQRHITLPVSPAAPSAPASPAPTRQPTRTRRPSRNRGSKGERERVFVIHGRNTKLQTELHAFLRSVGLDPIEWSHALRLSKKGSAHVSDIIDAAFKKAVAYVVLLTPDDEARLHPDFWKKNEDPIEKTLRKQARPNVLFEAGMAFGRNPDSTILVQVGKVKPFSDVGGRHVLHLNSSYESRNEFVIKLRNAGCHVDTTGTDWTKAGDFRLK